ncbi:MAG: LVIVD repeat-containing protein [Chitinophagales bacterium]
MKKILIAAVCFSFLFPLQSCLKDKITLTYQLRTPIYQVLTKFRESIKSQDAAAIAVTGKMTVYGNYIFISEPYKGIHVIDNSNPSEPKNISFINVPGNEDIAIADNTLYADAYGDLVTFDISNPMNVVTKNFDTNVFPEHSIYYGGISVNPDSINVIVGWNTRDTTVDYVAGSGGNIYPVLYAPGCANCVQIAANMSNTKDNSTGTGGSLSRFTIINNYLYTVSYSQLNSFDISNRFLPVFKNNLTVDWHIETIYPFRDKLFVGGNNGVYMYDVQSSPGLPLKVGEFTHVRGCDPVITDGNYAYVTLNDSSACLGFNNELQIVDVKDLNNSFLVKSYQLTHPVGLSKDGNNLFICDSKDGLKIFNAADINNLQLEKQLKDAEVLDVIAQNGLAIVMAKDGIYQYDYSDLNNIHFISKL